MNLSEFRTQYPQYDDMEDADLANSLHQKHYSDIPFEEFSTQIGLEQPGMIDTAMGAVGDVASSITNLFQTPEVTVPPEQAGAEFETAFGPGYMADELQGSRDIIDQFQQDVLHMPEAEADVLMKARLQEGKPLPVATVLPEEEPATGIIPAWQKGMETGGQMLATGFGASTEAMGNISAYMTTLESVLREKIGMEQLPEGKFDVLGEILREKGKYIQEPENLWKDPETVQMLENSPLVKGMRSAGHMIPALATGPLALWTMSADAAGQHSLEMEQMGFTPGQRFMFSTLYGAAEGIPEKLPFSQLMKRWGKGWFKEFGKYIGAEYAQETVTQGLQSLIEKATTRPDMTVAQFKNELFDMYKELPFALAPTVGMVKGGQALAEGKVPTIPAITRGQKIGRALQEDVEGTTIDPGIAELMAQFGLSPDTGLAPERVTDEVGPPAQPVRQAERATQEGVQQAESIINRILQQEQIQESAAADEVREAQEAKTKAEEIEATFEQQQKEKEVDYKKAREQKIEQDIEQAEAQVKAATPEKEQPTAMEIAFQEAEQKAKEKEVAVEDARLVERTVTLDDGTTAKISKPKKEAIIEMDEEISMSEKLINCLRI